MAFVHRSFYGMRITTQLGDADDTLLEEPDEADTGPDGYDSLLGIGTETR
jgi:hypothetical protein